MTADDIIAAARAALGTPFAHQGRMAGKGLDCVGLAAHIADTLGLAYTDSSGYGRRPSGGLLESALDDQDILERVSGQPQRGDLLVIRFKGEPQHVAIFDGQNLIHAYEPVGKVCEHGFTEIWRRKVVRVYRFKGLSNE